MIRQLEVYRVSLDPSVGSEMRKSRPCVVVSPNEMNLYLQTVIIVPLASKGIQAPSRVPCNFAGVEGQVALDQIRTVSVKRLGQHLGVVSPEDGRAILEGLQAIFSPE